MIAPIHLQCIFSYTVLANPGVEPQHLIPKIGEILTDARRTS